MTVALAIQISPHFYYPPIRATAISIEYRGAEYVLPWPDTARYPRLENFDDFKNDMIGIDHSPEEDNIWRRSTLISYGVYAQVRQLNGETDFPIVKIASKHVDARKHIQNEFDLLTTLCQITTVVKIHGVALVDNQGIFGFRMEKLDEISIEDRLKYIGQVRDAVEEVHKAGVAHCDLSFSNIMKRKQKVKLIDFGLSGKLGETIAHYHPLRRFFGIDVFSISIDDEKVDKLIQMAAQE